MTVVRLSRRNIRPPRPKSGSHELLSMPWLPTEYGGPPKIVEPFLEITAIRIMILWGVPLSPETAICSVKLGFLQRTFLLIGAVGSL